MGRLNLAQKVQALDKIAKEIENCRICKRDKIGKAVPGEGNADADIVFIGEAPGKKEAETGRPFVGRAGKLLRGMLEEIGIKDGDVYITSPVKYLPKYVTPKPSDIEHGWQHLSKQLDIIEPKVIVLMGNVAALAVLQEKFFIARDHGKIIKRDGRSYFLSYHPAAPLYSPKLREVIKKDFQKIKTMIKSRKWFLPFMVEFPNFYSGWYLPMASRPSPSNPPAKRWHIDWRSSIGLSAVALPK